MILNKHQIEKLIDACTESSEILLRYFHEDEDLEIESKDDSSPVTKADTESSNNLIKHLSNIINIPVMSEENTEGENLSILKNHSKFWLIDPLDGTWSYIKGSENFVVNIALIEDGIAIWGMIGVPCQNKIYYIDQDKNLIMFDGEASKHLNPVATTSARVDFLVSSRNLTQKIEDLVNQYESKTVTPIASAVKFCILAEGDADIYPRFKPTYSWDTAAGHALLNNIGGTILDVNTENELTYNTKLLNPSFIALRDKNMYLPWKSF